MGFLTGFPRYVLVQFKDSGTHVGETTLIDFDESEEFNYEEEYVVFWPDRPMATKAKPGEKKKKKYAAKILLFSDSKLYLRGIEKELIDGDITPVEITQLRKCKDKPVIPVTEAKENTEPEQASTSGRKQSSRKKMTPLKLREEEAIPPVQKKTNEISKKEQAEIKRAAEKDLLSEMASKKKVSPIESSSDSSSGEDDDDDELGENSSPPLPSKVASHQVSSSPASVRGKVTLSVLSRNSSMVDGSPTSSHQLDQHDGNFERRLSAIESKLDQFDGIADIVKEWKASRFGCRDGKQPVTVDCSSPKSSVVVSPASTSQLKRTPLKVRDNERVEDNKDVKPSSDHQGRRRPSSPSRLVSKFPITDAVIEQIPKTKVSLFVTKLLEYLYGDDPDYMATRTMTNRAATVGTGQKKPLAIEEVEQIVAATEKAMPAPPMLLKTREEAKKIHRKTITKAIMSKLNNEASRLARQVAAAAAKASAEALAKAQLAEKVAKLQEQQARYNGYGQTEY